MTQCEDSLTAHEIDLHDIIGQINIFDKKINEMVNNTIENLKPTKSIKINTYNWPTEIC